LPCTHPGRAHAGICLQCMWVVLTTSTAPAQGINQTTASPFGINAALGGAGTGSSLPSNFLQVSPSSCAHYVACRVSAGLPTSARELVHVQKCVLCSGNISSESLSSASLLRPIPYLFIPAALPAPPPFTPPARRIVLNSYTLPPLSAKHPDCGRGRLHRGTARAAKPCAAATTIAASNRRWWRSAGSPPSLLSTNLCCILLQFRRT
jgi:hypothetical protein